MLTTPTKKNMMKTNSKSRFVLLTLAAALAAPAAVMAQDSPNQGYLVDSSGSIVKSGSDLCWHTSDWTPARAVAPCDPVAIVAAAPMPAPAAAPAPVAMVPAPAAVLPMPQKMSFSADALFAFDKAELKPDGKVMLEDLAKQLKGASYDAIFVTGHADRLGRDAYNQKLSERRAESVKAYLVSQSIAADRVTAKGMGETQPVTKAGDCKGNKSASVIACLQPDRRVDVEVQASK